VRTELSTKRNEGELPAVVAVAICRAVREALLNVARHAGVGTASVQVEQCANRVAVEVVDTGQGFDPDDVPVHRRGIALSLVDRMAAVGGRASVMSSPDTGTRVRLEWPDG
jgi:signal transduction histidine kinase